MPINTDFRPLVWFALTVLVALFAIAVAVGRATAAEGPAAIVHGTGAEVPSAGSAPVADALDWKAALAAVAAAVVFFARRALRAGLALVAGKLGGLMPVRRPREPHTRPGDPPTGYEPAKPRPAPDPRDEASLRRRALEDSGEWPLPAKVPRDHPAEPANPAPRSEADKSPADQSPPF